MYHVFHPPDAYDIDIIRFETHFRAIPIKTKKHPACRMLKNDDAAFPIYEAEASGQSHFVSSY